MTMFLCTRCETWCEDFWRHDESGECDLIQEIRSLRPGDEELRAMVKELEDNLAETQARLENVLEGEPAPVLLHPFLRMKEAPHEG